MSKLNLEDAFLMWLSQYPEIPEPVREYRFCRWRRWRFDFAWPDQCAAVEVEGVTYDEGRRHQRAAGP